MQQNEELLTQKSQESDNSDTLKIEQKIKQAIKLINNQGRYQIFLITYISLCFVIVSYLLFSPSLLFMNPIFQCGAEKLRLSQDQACSVIETCNIVNTYTLTATAKLYCGQLKTQRNIIQSMLGFGTIIGIFVLSVVSDLKGRRFSFLISLLSCLLSCVFLLIGGFLQNVPLLMISTFCSGFGGNNILSTSYVYSQKLLSKKWCSRCIIISNGLWGISEMSLILFSDFFQDWYIMAIYFMAAPTILALLIGYMFLIEDPILTFSKRKYSKCKDSLERLKTINNTNSQNYQKVLKILQNLQQEISIQQQSKIGKKSNQKSLNSRYSLMKTPEILIPLICLSISSFGGNTYYYVTNYSIERTGNSYGLNIILLGFSEVISYILMLFYLDKMPRKLGSIIFSFFQSAIGFLFLMSFISQSRLAQSILIFFIRISAMHFYGVYILLQLQTFPRIIQGTCIGIMETIAQSGKLFAPFIVRFSQDQLINPMVTMSFASLILCIIPNIFIKQTLKKEINERKDQKNVVEQDYKIN